jgi:integrase/recombinase XerD
MTCPPGPSEGECPKRLVSGHSKRRLFMQGARPLSPDEIFKVLKHCNDAREECLVVIGMNLGLRVSELVSLQWKDVINRGKIFPVLYLEGFRTKGNKSRGIPINRNVARAIQQLREYDPRQALPDNYLFPGRTNGHLGSRHVNRLLYRLFDKASLSGRLSSHTLRKTFGTLLSSNGVGLPVIQELLGHADISTTRKYIGVGMGSLTNAVQTLAKTF